jgi:GNAT superfamily N-acetyltransferase
MIAPELIDRYLVEAWAMVGEATFPPITAKTGLIALLWKSSEGGQEVHGREIIDAASGERLGWCFLVRRGDVLDIEELFVWPTNRRRGYGRILADLARELASQMGAKRL